MSEKGIEVNLVVDGGLITEICYNTFFLYQHNNILYYMILNSVLFQIILVQFQLLYNFTGTAQNFYVDDKKYQVKFERYLRIL